MKRDYKELRKSFNSTAGIYDKETDTFHHKISEHLIISNMLLELQTDKNISILDAGGGTGKYSMILFDLGYNPELMDISAESVAIAESKAEKKSIKFKATVGNMEETPFKDEAFDFIMMNGGVISYTPDPFRLISETFRILKPGGRLWFDFCNSLGWAIENTSVERKAELSTAGEQLIQMPDWDYPARLFSLPRMESMLSDAGYKVKSKYGLVLLSNSLPLEYRYSKEYDHELIEEYKKAELEISRRQDCIGASWSCSICAEKQ